MMVDESGDNLNADEDKVRNINGGDDIPNNNVEVDTNKGNHDKSVSLSSRSFPTTFRGVFTFCFSPGGLV